MAREKSTDNGLGQGRGHVHVMDLQELLRAYFFCHIVCLGWYFLVCSCNGSGSRSLSFNITFTLDNAWSNNMYSY